MRPVRARSLQIAPAWLALALCAVSIAGGQDVPFLVKDINTTAINTVTADSFPQELTNVDGRLFFTAIDATNGYELWRSDGTTAGTVLVKDIVPGASGSFPSQLTDVDGRLFFTIPGPANGSGLWRSDGTAAGTVPLIESFYLQPNELTNANGTLFFTVITASGEVQLWRSDGTTDGTAFVHHASWCPEFGVCPPVAPTNVNGTLFFAGDNELWRSDGTTAGTVLVKNLYLDVSLFCGFGFCSFELAGVNGTLFFVASDGASGRELWRSDGTEAGTVLVKDINPGGGDAFFSSAQLTDVNGTLFFSASDPTHGTELWRSDGTIAGTTLVKDIGPGTQGSSPTDLTNVNGRLFFVFGRELWRSDGTAAGTALVMDLGVNGDPSHLTDVNGSLFFTIVDPTNGIELWRSDGTAAGTVVVEGLAGGAAPDGLTNVDGRLFFSAFAPETGTELWALGSPSLCPSGPESPASCKSPIESGRSRLDLRDTAPDSADQITWKWTKGMVTTKAEFGDPTATTDYAVCIYDTNAGAPRLRLAAKVPAGGSCGGRPCWKETDSAFRYANTSETPDGLRTILLKQGVVDGDARIAVKGRGVNLPLPALPLTQEPTVTVQLRSSSGGCWAADFSSAIANDVTRFKARAD